MKRLLLLTVCVVLIFIAVFSASAKKLEGKRTIEELIANAPIVSEHDSDSTEDKAGSASYISSLHIGPNVYHEGAYRVYTNDWFMIYFDDAYGMDFTYSSSLSYTVQLVRYVNFYTHTVAAQQNAVFTYNYQDRTCYMGECMSGKYEWNFQAPYTSGIDCDTLYLISY